MDDPKNGFTRDEYIKALSPMMPPEEAAELADSWVTGPEGGMPSEGLLDALSLVSDDCARRVQAIFGMTDEEARVRREAQARLMTGSDRLQDRFTQDEIEKALTLVMPSDDAKPLASRVFDGVEDPTTLDLPMQLVDLLLVVSDDCAKRVQTLFGWTDAQTAMRREHLSLFLQKRRS